MTMMEARKLKAGDLVTWKDPDDGACSDTFVLRSVRVHGGEFLRITKEDGSVLEALPQELS